MDKSTLSKSASEVFQASSETISEFRSKRDILCTKMNEAMMKRKDIENLIGGEVNLDMMLDNHANHLRFITSILSAPDKDTLVETISWVFRAYSSRGFTSNYWAAQINTWINIFKEELSEEAYREILPIYEWMSINIPAFSDMAAKMSTSVEVEPEH